MIRVALAALFIATPVTPALSQSAAPPPTGPVQTVKLRAGEVGPIYCPSGVLRSASVISGAPVASLVRGKRGAGGMTTLGVGGPRCLDLTPSDPKESAACVRLSAPSQSEVTIRMTCIP